jgi:hypothetical protein
MRRHLPGSVVLMLWICVTSLRSDPIYYAVFEGKNYEKRIWFSKELREFNANPPHDVYDLYTFERGARGTSIVKREYSTPSGDWLFMFTYHYAKNGRLQRIESEFRTFNGIDVLNDDEGLTRCVRSYAVTNTGRLRKISERITNMKSGREVARSFYEPEVKHWMHLRDLPIQPKP